MVKMVDVLLVVVTEMAVEFLIKNHCERVTQSVCS